METQGGLIGPSESWACPGRPIVMAGALCSLAGSVCSCGDGSPLSDRRERLPPPGRGEKRVCSSPFMGSPSPPLGEPPLGCLASLLAPEAVGPLCRPAGWAADAGTAASGVNPGNGKQAAIQTASG